MDAPGNLYLNAQVLYGYRQVYRSDYVCFEGSAALITLESTFARLFTGGPVNVEMK